MSTVYNINDIVDYVILRAYQEDDNSLLINLKLQKVMYYIQAWSLGIRKCVFFDGKFQAWIHGPVSISIYERFKDTKTLYSIINTTDVYNKSVFDSIKKEDSDFIDFILENYMCFSGVELENMTHSELPWQEARIGFKPTERCAKEISEETMKSFYGKKWENLINR